MLLGVMLSVKVPHSTSFLIQECFIMEGRVDSLRFLLALRCSRKAPMLCSQTSMGGRTSGLPSTRRLRSSARHTMESGRTLMSTREGRSPME
ncbi:unnamed protein product [Musa acuminata subsp. malaccensis]|uniref:(wild Malaysian banana) hypothetical protein n=1 Tax=Musa acuminata subsp. malaccensis TaxID=214687 RepID=A0A804IUF5_MUSAM|nr:unnamed protein product [Musa acuminata subsp. malaccensis]